MPQSPDLPRRLPSLRRACAVPGLLWLTAAVALAAGGQRAARPAAPAAATSGVPALPPLSMTCPMHPDVVERAPGTCPECKMNLIPVRLASGFTCPVHPVVNETSAGTCAICGRALIPVTVSLTWTCRGEPNPDHLEPGVCADGTPRVGARTLRPHGNHNPRFGGQFFMAPDNWHHLEGTYPRARVFRLYVFDDYARALTSDKLRQVKARVVTHETFNAATRTSTELRAFPLTVTRDGALEARVDAMPFPAVMTAKVRFTPDTPEYRFDFTFPAITTAPKPVAAPRAGAAASGAAGTGSGRTTPAARAPATSKAPAAPATGVPAPAASAPVARGTGSAARSTLPAAGGAGSPDVTASGGTDLSLVPFSIPATVPEILQQLRVRDAAVTRLVTAGDFGAVWVPAFQAKDLSIALEPSLGRLTPDARQSAEPAIQALVRAAWLLDAVGDLGNRQQVEAARAEFSTRAGEVVAAFAGLP